MKAKCKFLSLLLAVCMVFCTTPTVVLAADNVPGSVWTDYAAAEFAGGTGTEADPYQIATVEQLAKISKDVSEGTDYHGEFFKLTEDFDLSSHRWVPIGIYKWESDEDKTTTYKSFEGFIDGNNKTVSGLIVDERTDKYSAGFFGNIRNVKGGTVGAKNLIISKANIYADANGLSALQAGILAGVAMGNPGSPVIFENITVSGAIEITSNNIETDVGGMIGCGVRVKATDCNAENISVTGSNNSGGFIGIDNASVFENCTASGTVSGTWGLGGFVGYTGVATPNDPSTQSVFKNCAADVKIEGSDWRLGGFSGYAEYGEFNNCIAYGDITSTVTGWNPKVGGFIGESVNALVGNCHSTGTVISTSSDYQAGGFTGTYTGGTFTNCSFDKDKNSGLAAAGEGTISSGVEGRSSSEVLGNICEDYYGGHQYSNQWTVDTEATCAKDGSKSQRCERCGAKGNITVIPATGNHEWSVWQSNGNDTHTRTCKNCSGSQTENCTGGDATCLKKATCEGCGHEYGGFSAHELVCHEAKAATCDKDGYEAYWACDVCSKLFSDKNGTTEISQPVSIPATGHTPGTPATCTNPQTCTVCGAVLAEKLGHKAEKTEAKEPTETGAGNIAYWYCERCRKYFKDVELTQEITQEQTVLAATGKHEWGAWESNGNDTHTRTCKNCSGSQTENCTGGDATCLKKAQL